MGGSESAPSIEGEIICPKCPLTPIISILLNSEGILTCEYRCPFMHFGQIPFDELTKDKENKHGKFCDRCKLKGQENEINNENKNDLKYCGTCKQFICPKCLEEHSKEKESHVVLVESSKISYTCLEHNEKYNAYCFTCLKSICKNCKRHEKHCKKLFEEFYPEKEFIDTYEFYMGDYKGYLKSFKRSHGMNREHFANFKNTCSILLNLAKYLFNNFNQKKKLGILNGEIIINLLNVVNFDYRSENLETNEEFVKYCKNHLILSNKPISDICTFSKTKSDYKIGKLEMEEYNTLDVIEGEKPKYFKCSPVGKQIAFMKGKNSILFLSTNLEENNSFKIRLNETINSFNIINQNILCICADKLYLYELQKKSPYYTEYKDMPVLDILKTQVFQVIGNIEKNLIIRTQKELLVVNDQKKKNDFQIVAKDNLEDINNTIEENKTVPDTNPNNNYYYYGYGNRTKQIKIIKNRITTLKAIWNNYLVNIEGGIITTRNVNDLKKIKTLSPYKDIDCIVYNGNVLIYEGKDILFYSIPNLVKVSCVSLNDTILSINVVNKKTFIVVESKYIEQFETKTWKRISRQIGFGDKIDNKNLYVIGVDKTLFFFNKDNNTFYKGIEKKEEDEKKGKQKK